MTNRLKQAWQALCGTLLVVALAGCNANAGCEYAQEEYGRAKAVADACRADPRCVMTASEYEVLVIHEQAAKRNCKIAKGERRGE